MSAEVYNANLRPKYSDDDIRRELAAIMRAIPSALRTLTYAALPTGSGTWDPGAAAVITIARAMVLLTASIGNAAVAASIRLGQVLQLHTASSYGGVSLNTWSNTAAEAPILDLNRSNSPTIGTQATVNANDVLGHIAFRGSNGSAFLDGAYLKTVATGTPSTNVPSRVEVHVNDGATDNTASILTPGGITGTQTPGSFTVPALHYHLSVGPLTIGSGVVVTVDGTMVIL